MVELARMVDENLLFVLAGVVALCLAVLALCMLQMLQMRRLQKLADRFFGTKGDKRYLEGLLAACEEKADAVSAKYDGVLFLIDDINERLRFCIQRVGVVRYNPFEGMGGDLSFAAAILDDHHNGIVFSAIHGREASYAYAKPVIGGKSTYSLSEEELKAIEKAIYENKLVGAYD